MSQMQEAKYCEDIVPQIKASLESLGYTNEHDRLGHFEAVVPADTFFGLARNQEDMRFFALQFKAPKRTPAGPTWNLTHTPGQFETVRSAWSSLIFYSLPWYMDPLLSPAALDHTLFLDSSQLPPEAVEIVLGLRPFPREYFGSLCAATYSQSEADPGLSAAIADKGIEPIVTAIHEYSCARSLANNWNTARSNIFANTLRAATMRKVSALALVLKFDSHHTANLLVHGGEEELNPQLQKSRFEFNAEEWGELQRIVNNHEENESNGRLYWRWKRWDSDLETIDEGDPSNKLSAALAALRVLGIPSAVVDASSLPGVLPILTKYQSIGDWHKAGHKLCVRLHVSVRRPRSTDVLEYRTRITVSELEYSIHNLLENDHALRQMLSSDGETAGLSWPAMLSRIQEGKLGVALSTMELGEFKRAFGRAFPRNHEGLLVWYSHVRRVFYAIETRRLARGGEGVLSTVTDPFAAGLSPEQRRQIAEEARRRHLPPSELLSEIVDEYFEEG
jgi:hypothetical protein